MKKYLTILTDQNHRVRLEIADGVPIEVVLRTLAREPGALTPENEAKVRRAFGVADDA
jgi:hypothetical protein